MCQRDCLNVENNLNKRSPPESKFLTTYLKYGKFPIDEGLSLIEINIPYTTPEDTPVIADII